MACSCGDQNKLYEYSTKWGTNLLGAIMIVLIVAKDKKKVRVAKEEWETKQRLVKVQAGRPAQVGGGKRRSSTLSEATVNKKMKGAGSVGSQSVTSFGSPWGSSKGGLDEGRSDSKDVSFNSTFRAILALFPTTLATSKCIHVLTNAIVVVRM